MQPSFRIYIYSAIIFFQIEMNIEINRTLETDYWMLDVWASRLPNYCFIIWKILEYPCPCKSKDVGDPINSWCLNTESLYIKAWHCNGLGGDSFSLPSSHSRTNPGISWEEFAISDGFRIVDTGDWETEIPEWFVAGAPFTDITVQGQPTADSLRTSKKKPPGLSLEDINCLQREVFNVVEGDGVSRAMRECCICLESFQKGDVLICLPCDHRYHPDCLDPWVKACGDCPYCRTGIVIDRVGHRKLQNPRWDFFFFFWLSRVV